MTESDLDRLRAMLDHLENENNCLKDSIDAYSAELAISTENALDWEEKWTECNEELTEIKLHLESMRKGWVYEFCRELGHEPVDGGCATCHREPSL